MLISRASFAVVMGYVIGITLRPYLQELLVLWFLLAIGVGWVLYVARRLRAKYVVC